MAQKWGLIYVGVADALFVFFLSFLLCWFKVIRSRVLLHSGLVAGDTLPYEPGLGTSGRPSLGNGGVPIFAFGTSACIFQHTACNCLCKKFSLCRFFFLLPRACGIGKSDQNTRRHKDR